jgi:hypothetical protein
MNRTLRRPMFRIGGVAEGITSGLQPRQGYDDGKKVNKLGSIRDMTIPQLRELAGEMSYRPRGTNIYDFMTQMGLDLVSRPKSGNIFQQVATSAKGPYDKYLAGKKESDLQQYASESDMFKTLIGAQADIMGSEGGSKMFSKEQAANAMAGYMKEWHDLLDARDTMDATEWNREKNILWASIGQYQKENPAIQSLFEDKDYAKSVKTKIKNQLKTSQKLITVDDPDNPGQKIQISEALFYKDKAGDKYGGGTDALYFEVGKRYLDFYEQMTLFGSSAEVKAEGGRVGYQGGGDVAGGIPTAMPHAQVPTDQGEMPQELSGITYEELRARLPQEVGDDIVRLLANSSEALEDFASIQTEQDIANFNKKYGVNLVLPSGG